MKIKVTYIVSFAKHSLHISKWNCKYHIAFAQKYRRKVFYEEKRLEVGAILQELCNWKRVHIIAAKVCPDHIHMFFVTLLLKDFLLAFE